MTRREKIAAVVEAAKPRRINGFRNCMKLMAPSLGIEEDQREVFVERLVEEFEAAGDARIEEYIDIYDHAFTDEEIDLLYLMQVGSVGKSLRLGLLNIDDQIQQFANNVMDDTVERCSHDPIVGQTPLIQEWRNEIEFSNERPREFADDDGNIDEDMLDELMRRYLG